MLSLALQSLYVSRVYRYSVIRSPDGQFGGLMEDGYNWTGMVGALQRKVGHTHVDVLVLWDYVHQIDLPHSFPGRKLKSHLSDTVLLFLPGCEPSSRIPFRHREPRHRHRLRRLFLRVRWRTDAEAEQE